MNKFPVLLITWKRPLLAKKVIEVLRNVKPAKVYLASDGPRENVKGEDSLVLETRSILRNCIDWNCEIHELFSDVNQGCALGVSNAITWFFQNEEEGIILEDDCLPDPLFFDFCSTMLNKYRNNPQVMHIGSVNFALSNRFLFGDYRFSQYAHIWGWATWRESWNKFDLLIKDDNSRIKKVLSVFRDNKQIEYWNQIFTTQRDNPIDTWDYSWQFCIWKNCGISVMPNFNLVKNIGFGNDASHTFNISENTLVYDNKNETKVKFSPSRLRLKMVYYYLDYIVFLNAFKRKKYSFFHVKLILGYLKNILKF